MQITNPSSQPASVSDSLSLRGRDGAASPAQILDRLNLRDGEARLARILVRQEAASASTSNPQAGNTRALLEIAGQQLSVQADSRIPAGELIRVLRAGNALQLAELPQQPQRSALSQALAQKLPFQHHLGDGVRQLLQVAQHSPQPQVREALQQVLNLLPQQSSLTTAQTPGNTATPAGSDSALVDRIRQWISTSGHYAEPRLATAPRSAEQPIPTDLKQALFRAAAALMSASAQERPGAPDLARQFGQLTPAVSPELIQSAQLQFPATAVTTAPQATGGGESLSVGETLRLLAGMLNRISVNQLHSQLLSSAGGGADTATANQTTSILELPWISQQGDAKLAQLRIEQREEGASEDDNDPEAREQEWRLSLALDLDGLGPLYFDLNLRQRALKARVWAESGATASLVDATSERLAERLRALDLEVPPIQCHVGKPVQLKTRLSQHLVDERA